MLREAPLCSSSRPQTFRRKFLDVGGKVVKTGRRVYLDVSQAAYDRLSLEDIRERVNSPPDWALN